MANVLSIVRLSIQSKIEKKKKNKGQKENPKKRIVEAIVTNADHSTNKFSEINLSYFVFEVNLINNLRSYGLTLLLHVMYAMTRGCF
jgi:hypothetical protein